MDKLGFCMKFGIAWETAGECKSPSIALVKNAASFVKDKTRNISVQIDPEQVSSPTILNHLMFFVESSLDRRVPGLLECIQAGLKRISTFNEEIRIDMS